MPARKLESLLKRCFDLAAASLGLAATAPLLACAAAALRLTGTRPVLFKQPRVGLGQRIFTLYKFRTMHDARGPDGALLPDHERLTPVGRVIRAASIDELPQLWNVLQGHMSLVGPRPLLAAYLPRYNAFQRRRHEVRPGITGWAQIHGRNAITWERKFEMDVWYVDHHTLRLDLKILSLTFWKTLRREGISQQGHATMPEFRGSTGGLA